MRPLAVLVAVSGSTLLLVVWQLHTELPSLPEPSQSPVLVGAGGRGEGPSVPSIVVTSMLRSLGATELVDINRFASRCREIFGSCFLLLLYDRWEVEDPELRALGNVELVPQRCRQPRFSGLRRAAGLSTPCQCHYEDSRRWLPSLTQEACFSYGAGRNLLLDRFLAHPVYSSATYYAVMDVDRLLNTSEDRLYAAVARAVSPPRVGAWDAVMFIGACHYDWMAMRCTPLDENCWWARPPRCYNGSGYTYNETAFPCFPRIRKAPLGTLIQVSSAFNGLAIYKTAELGGCRYGDEDCEHVVLHRCMERRGKRLRVTNGGFSVNHHVCLPL